MVTLINLTVRVTHDDGISSRSIAKTVKEILEIPNTHAREVQVKDDNSERFGVTESTVERLAYAEVKVN